MGLLDDAIREHLDLKRRRGADATEVDKLEHEALGPVRREDIAVDAPQAAGEDAPFDVQAAPVDEPVSAGSVPLPEPGEYDAFDDAPHAEPPAAHELDEPESAAEYDSFAPGERHLVDPPLDPRPRAAPLDLPPAAEDPQETVAFRVPDAEPEAAPDPVAPAVEPTPPEPDPDVVAADPEHDELEETPDFLQETPEHDRLWFEQKPPRDFDFWSTHRLTTLDVFTDVPLAGNQLAVVHDADAVPDHVQQAFAVETKLSETTFVQTPTVDGPSYRNRIWTTTREMRFAGHPSLGTAVAVAAAEGDSSVSYVQQTPAGLQPLRVSRDGDVWHAEVLLEPTTLGDAYDPGALLAAVGLGADDVDGELTPQIVGTGGENRCLVVLGDVEALGRVAVDHAALTRALESFDNDMLYLAARREDGAMQARAFFVDVGFVSEDPATGSAAAPLAGYLHDRLGIQEVVVHQGVEMGRPSVLRCTIDDGHVRLSGDVVVVSVGEVRLPAG